MLNINNCNGNTKENHSQILPQICYESHFCNKTSTGMCTEKQRTYAGAAIMDNNMKGPQKLKNAMAI